MPFNHVALPKKTLPLVKIMYDELRLQEVYMHRRKYRYSFVTVLLAGAIILPGIAYADEVSQDAYLSQSPVTESALQANALSEELNSANNQQTESSASQSNTTPANPETTLDHSDQANTARGQ